MVKSLQSNMFRIRIVAFIIMLFLILISVWSIGSSVNGLRQLAMDIKIKETELARKDRDYQAHAENVEKLSLYMQQLEEVKHKISPYPTELYHQIIELDRLMEAHKLQPHIFNTGNILPAVIEQDDTAVYFARLEIAAYGEYDNAINFVHDLQNSKTFYDIERLSLRNKENSEQIEILITMSMYYRYGEGEAGQGHQIEENDAQSDRNPFKAEDHTATGD